MLGVYFQVPDAAIDDIGGFAYTVGIDSIGKSAIIHNMKDINNIFLISFHPLIYLFFRTHLHLLVTKELGKIDRHFSRFGKNKHRAEN